MAPKPGSLLEVPPRKNAATKMASYKETEPEHLARGIFPIHVPRKIHLHSGTLDTLRFIPTSQGIFLEGPITP